LSHHRDQGNLTHVGAFAAHIRACQDKSSHVIAL
jgi:hypothetical protein